MDDAARYLDMLANEIHSVVVATTDIEGHPVTRVIDIMLSDAQTIYFLTAKGKAFAGQLMDTGFIALTGMTGGASLDRAHASLAIKAISLRGTVECIGQEKLDEIFEKNPYMAQIYPTDTSRQALVVFCMEEGEGELFDLSTKPITRKSFRVGAGEAEAPHYPYLIGPACIGCGACLAVCP